MIWAWTEFREEMISAGFEQSCAEDVSSIMAIIRDRSRMTHELHPPKRPVVSVTLRGDAVEERVVRSCDAVEARQGMHLGDRDTSRELGVRVLDWEVQWRASAASHALNAIVSDRRTTMLLAAMRIEHLEELVTVFRSVLLKRGRPMRIWFSRRDVANAKCIVDWTRIYGIELIVNRTKERNHA
jgi:hypothetical protein